MNAKTNIRADLGPTNTGKTHHAIQRMLQYRTGMIGLPLRLLAREVYDKLVASIGMDKVSLITGEERLIGARTQYWVATVEAMPRDVYPEIVVVDEIQLCADPERGHIFTDRLLHARGTKETLFLGSHAMRPALSQIIPDANLENRPRISALKWVGRRKLSHLPPRSAVVAFSAEAVYATAELLRRQNGGAAVVMGGLSPRTRNAQVHLYQSGQVDYIVATDAIGMGLNLDIHNVFFAGTEKFDGRRYRELFPHELAQIAGRAGRYLRDGGFGITANAESLSPAWIDAIESHRFAPVKKLEWRNSKLNFGGLDRLLSDLGAEPPLDRLQRVRECDDLRALRHLSAMPEIRDLVNHPRHVELLWQVCQLPDFPKFAAGEHLALVENIFRQLRGRGERISQDTIESAVRALEKPAHNIEILARKLSQIRTWTYIAQRKSWLENAEAWRQRTRQVEDSLSDALHQGLVQRFVDQRTSHLRNRLKERKEMTAKVSPEGEVTIDGEFVGRLNGFQFEVDPSAKDAELKAINDAARTALKPLFHLRTEALYNAADKDISLSDQHALIWDNAAIGRLAKGQTAMQPKVEVFADDHLPAEMSEKITRRLDQWLTRQREAQLAPLLAIENDDELTGLTKGVGFQLVEALGLIPRREIADDIKNLSQEQRGMLRKHGVRFGQFTIFCPLLLKPAPTEFRLMLSALWREESDPITAPPAGLVTIPAHPSYSTHHYTMAGYHLAGERAIRVDMLERLADLLRNVDRSGFEATPDMLSITGLSLDQLADLLSHLGYEAERSERIRANPTKAAKEAMERGEEVEPEVEVFYTFRMRRRPQNAPKTQIRKKKPKGAPKGKTQRAKPKVDKPIDPDNPFAALMALKENSQE